MLDLDGCRRWAPLRNDATLILLSYRHGLRVRAGESAMGEQSDFKAALRHVNRSKKGIASVHPLRDWSCRPRLEREPRRGRAAGATYPFNDVTSLQDTASRDCDPAAVAGRRGGPPAAPSARRIRPRAPAVARKSGRPRVAAQRELINSAPR